MDILYVFILALLYGLFSNFIYLRYVGSTRKFIEEGTSHSESG